MGKVISVSNQKGGVGKNNTSLSLSSSLGVLEKKVLLINDDYTPMEFVGMILERFFGLTNAQAFDIMITVHKKGLAVVGVFSYEVAETKVAQVMDCARQHQHPLQCTMEKE